MNILEAIEKMRMGHRVARPQRTVSKCWLEIEFEQLYNEEGAEIGMTETIMFCCAAITKEHNWVGEYPAHSKKWGADQEGITADDWSILP